MPRRPTPPGTGASGDQPRPGEIYVQFQPVGQAVKVIAVDAATGMEVVVMGPATASRADLQNVAVRKLKAQLSKTDK